MSTKAKRLIMACMEKRTREKIALVVFALLVVLAGVVLISYFATGRSWNMAASFVDDTIGNMDGYTVVAYAGTVEPEKDEVSEPTPELPESDVAEAEAEAEAQSDGQDAVLGVDDASTGEGASDGGEAASNAVSSEEPEDADAEADGVDADAGNADADADGANDTGVAAMLAEARTRYEAESGAGDDTPLGLFSFLPTPFSNADESVYVSDVRITYERKGANVLTLDAASNRYADPQVLSVGGKRIGVYSTGAYTSRARIRNIDKFFDENDVDVVMYITPRADMLATYEGIDVVIVTTDREEGLSVRGETYGETLVVRAPEKGEVGVVLLTTNNVVSAKVISSL